MQLPPPPGITLASLPWQPGAPKPGPALKVGELDASERKVWRRAQAALAAATAERSFIEQLYGQLPVLPAGVIAPGRMRCVMPMGLHAGNRVGHAQGGVTFALSALTASAAAPAGHRLVEASAWYLNPGEGRSLRCDSKVTRAGRRLSVVDTTVTGNGGTRVVEMVSTHSAVDGR